MNRRLKEGIIVIMAICALVLIYNVFFIRVVNYEIGGSKIPSRYNVLTGSVKPIAGYKGTASLPVVKPQVEEKAGLTEGEIAVAKLRWSIFEEWANTHPEYKGWAGSVEIFKKANEAFKEEMKDFGVVTQK